MVAILKSAAFDQWLRKLKDRRAAVRVLIRIDRLAGGNKSSQRADIDEAQRIAKDGKNHGQQDR